LSELESLDAGFYMLELMQNGQEAAVQRILKQ
jgi:hypothetical protein